MGGLIQFGVLEEPVDDHTVIVGPTGEIDALTAPQLGRHVLGVVDAGKTSVVVDLSHATFIDSTGIGVLLNAVKALSARRGRLVLVCPHDRVLRPFEVTGLTERLSIFRSREDALGSLTPA